MFVSKTFGSNSSNFLNSSNSFPYNNKISMKIKKGFVLRELCGEYMVAGEGMEQINFNKLIRLNASAAYLWQEVAEREFTADMLAELLVGKYGIPEPQAQADATALCQVWKREGLIE